MKQILKWIFRKDFQMLEDEIKKNKNEINSLKSQLIYSKEDFENHLTQISKICKCKENSIIGIEENKLNEKFYLVKNESKDTINFYLYSFNERAINRNPFIYAQKREHVSKDGKNTLYIYIKDICAKDKKVGNGSLLMNALITYVKNSEYSHISGELSSVDKDDFDFLEAFYKKFGYVVTFETGKTSGSIKLII